MRSQGGESGASWLWHACAGELPAVLATDHRRTAKKLAEAGRWVEAVHEAQEAHTLDDALLLRAITGLAEQVRLPAVKAKDSPLHGHTCTA